MRASFQGRWFEGRGILALILLAATIWSLTSVDWAEDVIHPGGWSAALDIAKSIFTPEVSPSFLKLALEASWTTVTYAVAAITIAVAIGFPLGVIASGVLARSSAARFTSIVGLRFLLAFLRSIHELVWGWLFVVAIGLSPMAAILALSIPYSGILGRIYAEILSDVPEEPLRALRSSGASELTVLFYGRLPLALPDMLSYTFYRFECGIRSAAILSFVGIQGLGYQIQLSLDDLLFGEAWTMVLFLIALIVLVDLWSNIVRRSLVS